MSRPVQLDLRQVLLGSAFRLNLNPDAADARTGPRLTAWGRVAGTTFQGTDQDLALVGDVLTGTVGLDAAQGRWFGGVAVAHSRGNGTYTIPLADGASDLGDLAQILTSLQPYLRYAVTDRLDVWGLLGYGWGGLEMARASGGMIETDTSLMLGAFGSRGFSGSVGQTFTPTVELGLRHDWGDAETGFGVEVGGRVQYSHPGLGLTVDAAVRGLLAHEDTDYGEWGASGTVRLAPGEGGQSLALTLFDKLVSNHYPAEISLALLLTTISP